MEMGTEATRLQDIVFFREGEGQRRFDQRDFTRGRVLYGRVTGTLENPALLIAHEAAKDGQLGLHLEVAAETEATAWQLEITPEKKERHYPEHAPPYFDVHAYQARGTVEFDLRGQAKGKGLGLTFRSEDHPSPRLTPLDVYMKDTVGWQHVIVPVKDLDLATPDTEFMLADQFVIGSDGMLGNIAIDLDNIVLRSDSPEPERGPVRVDHVGYLPDQRKAGFVGGSRLRDLTGQIFQVRLADENGKPTGEPVFEGRLVLRGEFEPKLYGEWLYEADFSPLRETGRYVLEVPGIGKSVPFYIHEAIYDYLYYHLARFFFYQRNGCALPAANAFEWARGEIYAQPIPYLSDPSKKRIIRHGWFDAGDSRLYPHTDRIGPLLLAWELAKEHNFDGQLNLPESGNGVPDLLDEIRFHVEYLREIQRDDGSCPGYTMTGKGNGNPIGDEGRGYESDGDPRYIHDTNKPRGGLQTGQICATFAMVARCLRPYDAEGAMRFEQAARRAWAWLERPGQRSPLTARERPNRLWAAVELWRLTREDRFHAAVRQLAGGEVDEAWDGYAWRERTSAWIAWFSYAIDEEGDPALRASFRHRFLDRVDTLFGTSASDPYGVAIYIDDYYFALADLGRTAGVLALAWKLTGDDKYRLLAEDHLHFLCGRNIHRLCAISNIAPEAHSEPYHMLEWTPERQTWMPGYVAYMAVNSTGTLSRFRAREFRVFRSVYWFSEPCVGFNFGPTVAAMLLMEGKRYPDLINQGALPGVKPFRPGLPFPPSTSLPWGAKPVVPPLPAMTENGKGVQ